MGADCSSCCDTTVDQKLAANSMDRATTTVTASETEDDEARQKMNKTNKTNIKSIKSLRKAWIKAVDSNDNHALRQLFKDNHKQINFLKIKWVDGDNSLHKAAQANNIKLARFLLLLKININAINDKNGNTALHYAVKASHEKMIKLLLKYKNIDLNIFNSDGMTALNIAEMETNSLSVQKLLLVSTAKRGGGNTETNKKINDALNQINQETMSMLQSRGRSGSAGYRLTNDVSNSSRLTSLKPAGYSQDGSVSANEGSNGLDGNNSFNSFEKNNIGGMSLTYTQLSMEDVADGSVKRNFKDGAVSPAKTELNTIVDFDKSIKKAQVSLKQKLEKKGSKFPYNYKPVWVMICKPYILWSKKDIDITDEDINKEQTRLKFGGYISISAIEKIKTQKKKEFVINVRNAHHVKVTDVVGHQKTALKMDREKQFTFRCPDEPTREKWIAEINRSMDSSVHDALLELYHTGLDI